ncbi:DeoR/GlpR family DNA-binding transcription regulator [Lactobacillus sp. ESL0791]|uniref:DeoR/GlpR family DNA-binding transcription regulator n=1 Tax=Lactobacillus sp. ESL0791 TaxID=2983234 RepID=UPI0023F93952|nr:DeoR/GlpR family DNA-binding transcription regulator [Lactobacillus sp. ESL0791]MDF7638249.1 DeoR/GlpR family DNA-binding transcription regulator [Lactobacillus sp. ESL0791]
MITKERQRLIENYVNKHSFCQVSKLCDLTATSISTIRRDLIQMERQGMIKRVRGGVQSVRDFSGDISQRVRFNLNHRDKIRIARSAAENYVHENDTIFLDAGTTTFEMVPFIARIPGVTLVTNDPETALASLEKDINTLLIGGKIKEDTHAAVGQFAQAQIKTLNFTASFLGANGVDSVSKLTTPDVEEAAVKKLVLTRSDQAYVLVDSSKIGRHTFATFADFSEVVIITNLLSKQQKQALPEEINLHQVINIEEKK